VLASSFNVINTNWKLDRTIYSRPYIFNFCGDLDIVETLLEFVQKL